ncbi:MAG: PQQ-dependent dehydrogenase, methanol/ethanol family [Pseudomonadota bacterium]
MKLRNAFIIAALTLTGGSAPDEHWTSYGRDASEQRFSPLDQINVATASQLGLAWRFDMRDGRGVEATPLEVDGVLYVTSAWSVVYALDATTGKPLWEFDPGVDRSVGARACCDAVNRGLAYLDGRIFVAALDGRLIALDARTGRQVWSTQTLDGGNWPYVITGAPRVAGNLVLIGNSGADLGARGYVTAYDAETGTLAWRFFTVPGNPANGPDHAASDPIMAKVAKTWAGEWWKQGGGGTVWDSITYDEVLGQVYIGVGNGAPWNRQVRSADKGDNWFLASIVALDARTGQYRWHYQATPGDTWDATATQSIILADMKIAGKSRKVLMQAPKNGFFYVIDRRTGKLLSAGNIVPMAKTADTPKGAPISWAYGIDLKTGRPLENPEARYPGNTRVLVHPTGMGAHSWQPMAYSPKTNFAFIPTQDYAATFQADPQYRPTPNARASGLMPGGGIPQDSAVRAAIATSVHPKLIAWDVTAQKPAWTNDYAFAGNGGLLATDGNLVFQSGADGIFRAINALTGKPVWTFDAQATAMGGPITYRIGGIQYIAIAIGNGGSHWLAGGLSSPQRKALPTGRVLVFKLGGTLPYDRVDTTPDPVDPPEAVTSDKAVLRRGAEKYGVFCAACHGFGAISGQVLPDLRRSPVMHDADAFRMVVKEGALLANGMPQFGAELPDTDVEAIRAFVADEARFVATSGSR